MPFLTEHLWQLLQPMTGGTSWSGRHLMLQAWPEPQACLRHDGAGARMAQLQEIVVAVRGVRNLQQLADGVALGVTLAAGDQAADLERDRAFISDRANLDRLDIIAGGARPDGTITAVVGALRLHVSVQGSVDQTKLREILVRRQQALVTAIKGKEGRLGNADYVAKAPPAQVEETRLLLARERAELAGIGETLAGLAG
jgi:valyl-tRNA synthetase